MEGHCGVHQGLAWFVGRESILALSMGGERALDDGLVTVAERKHREADTGKAWEGNESENENEVDEERLFCLVLLRSVCESLTSDGVDGLEITGDEADDWGKQAPMRPTSTQTVRQADRQ